MTAQEKIQALVETRINGNSIRGNKTYENMLRSVTLRDITSFAYSMDLKYNSSERGRAQKLDLINSIVKWNFK